MFANRFNLSFYKLDQLFVLLFAFFIPFDCFAGDPGIKIGQWIQSIMSPGSFFTLGVSGILIVILFWWVKSILPKWVKIEVQSQVKGLTDTQNEVLAELARMGADDLLIRKKYKILVLGSSNNLPEFIKKMQQRWSLRIECESFDLNLPPEKVNHWKNFDCILIDNLTQAFLPVEEVMNGAEVFKELEKLGQHLQGGDQILFYLGKNRVHTPDVLGEHFLFANSYAQLTGNLFNALRYLETVRS